MIKDIEVKTEQTLEAMLAELEKIAATLEGGDQPLEQALQLFENGIRLARHGQKRIEAAEARIEILLGAGTAQETLTAFDDAAGEPRRGAPVRAETARSGPASPRVSASTTPPMMSASSPRESLGESAMRDNPPPIEEDDLPF